MASGKAAVHAAPSSSHSSLASFDNMDLNSLTPQQLDELSNLLQARKSESSTDRLNGNISSIPWIIDTGASHHMSGCLSHFSNLKLISPLSVGLPNGDLTIATQSVIFTYHHALCYEMFYMLIIFTVTYSLFLVF